MELWIRSQDKEDLVKVENIRCWNETQIAVNVKTSFNNVDYVVVGEYETKERALEVLDEIQNMMKIDININASYETADLLLKSNILNNMVKIYKMPKE